VERVVGRVRQVDLETRSYPPHLLLGPVGTPGLASRPACRSGGGHVQGEAESEFSIGALVRIRPPIVHTVGDIGLDHPNRVVS
jgi:hypothetical protein